MTRGKSGTGHRKAPAQKKPPLTHFLCIPLVTAESKPQLEASLAKFRANVSPSPRTLENTQIAQEATSESGDKVTSNVHPKAIRPVGVLHCTLGVMSLSQEKLTEATRLLQTLNLSSLLDSATPTSSSAEPTSNTSNSPLKISLKGLTSMHSPQKTSILYTAPSDPTNRLQPFCQALQDAFKKAELLVPDDRPLKLHATIVNTIYAKGRKKPPPRRQESMSTSTGADAGGGDDRSQGHGPNANAPLKVDARGILERYEDYVWAENVVLDRVAICEMGAKKKFDGDENVVAEEYEEVTSLALPR